MPRRFLVTGPPGAGKTTLILRLQQLGHDVVEEAATSVIAREQAAGVDAPWERPDFVDEIATFSACAKQHRCGHSCASLTVLFFALWRWPSFLAAPFPAR